MAIKSNLKNLTPAREKYSRKVQLLSGGLINAAAFPDGQIKIYPWDFQIDEWVMNRMRKGSIKGHAILFHVLPKVCDLNGCKLIDFVASEVMMVLMLSRSILRNDVIEYSHQCPECMTEFEDKVKVPDQLERIGEKKFGWPGYDEITLPDVNDIVRVRPITVGEELAILDRAEATRQNTCGDDLARVLAGIITINGGKPENPQELLTWIRAISPSDAAFLIEQFDKLQPQLSTTLHLNCDACGKDYDHSLKLNEDFFRGGSKARSGRKVGEALHPSVQEPGNNVEH